jgi:SAM-dependent methyltransferase
VRAANLLSPAEAAGIYTEDYFAGEEYGDYLADREVHLRNFAARWRDMRRIAGEIPSVFEVGCAYGLFLEYASSQGAKAEGIDVCGPAVEHAAKRLGQRAIAGDFLSAAIAPGEHRAFCLWDTIEHLPHPEAVIARVVELLPPRGWLFLTTGDIGSPLARFRGRRWRMIHPPSHLQYFSRQTIRKFLARHGLTVVEIRSISVYRTVHSVLSGLRALGRGFSRTAASLLSRAVPVGVQQRIGMRVNLGDIMMVAARRK